MIGLSWNGGNLLKNYAMNSDITENRLLYAVYFIYFFCGMAMCFEGAFMPEFKEYFSLNYQQQMFTMFAKNIPFVVFSILIGLLSEKIGFKNCLTLAMFLFAAGTALLIPGLHYRNYSIILIAFFIIGTGFNFELVAGNPLLSGLGSRAGSSSRLNLGNALGAIAQIISPLFILLILPVSAVNVRDKIPYIEWLFGAITIILLVTGLITLLISDVTLAFRTNETEVNVKVKETPLLANRKLLMGFTAIFITLGVEAGIFGLFRNYLEDKSVAALSSHQSYILFTVYFAMFAVGRLVGAYIQRKIRPALTLVFCLIASMILLISMITTTGIIAVISITSLGFFISIFFPTLYSISIEGLGKNTAIGSGLLTMGFLGAALLPVVQGKIADGLGLKYSFLVSFISYLYLLYLSLKLIRGEAKGGLRPHSVQP
jgi:MFS transporter, FHS family, L-fucose permease